MSCHPKTRAPITHKKPATAGRHHIPIVSGRRWLGRPTLDCSSNAATSLPQPERRGKSVGRPGVGPGPHTPRLIPQERVRPEGDLAPEFARCRFRVSWALAAGTWQRVTLRSRAVRGPPQPGHAVPAASQVLAWPGRPLPLSCAIGWTCQTCGRAVIDARVRRQRRRQPGEHFGLRQPGLQVMDDGAQEP